MGDFTDRRTVLRSSAAACAAGLAGCLGVLDDSEDSDGNESDVADGGDLDGNESDSGGGDPEPTLDEWPMFQYDAGNSGHAEGSGPTGSLEVTWEFERDEPIRGGPVVADGTVYAGCEDENLYALDLDDGSVEWSTRLGLPVTDAPLVYDDLVVVSVADGLYAFDRETGEEYWQFDVEPESGTTTPVVEDGTIVVGTGEPSLYGIDAATGSRNWAHEMPRNIREPASIAGDTVFATDWTNEIYVRDLEDGSARYSKTIDELQVTGTTVVDNVIYIGGRDGRLFALDSGNLGDQVWSFEAQNRIVASPAVASGKIFVTDEEANIYAINSESGEEIWREQFDYYGWSAPAAVGGLVYVGDGLGTFYVLDSNSGKQRSSLNLNERMLLSPAITQDVAVVGGFSGSLYCLSA